MPDYCFVSLILEYFGCFFNDHQRFLKNTNVERFYDEFSVALLSVQAKIKSVILCMVSQ